jgi:hypothetical protein
MHRQGAFFVTRAKRNVRFKVRDSRLVDKTTGLRCDQTVYLSNYVPRHSYPEGLRRIRYFDSEHHPLLSGYMSLKYSWLRELVF